MTDKPSSSTSKVPLSPQDWDSLIDDFNNGGSRLNKYSFSSILDNALLSLLKKEFPLKHNLLVFLEDFSQEFFTHESDLDRLLDTLRTVVQAPLDGVTFAYSLKEQFMVSATSIFISIDALYKFPFQYIEALIELLLTVINRPNHGLDRQTRAVACECLRQLEISYPCLLSAIGAHLFNLSQAERTHTSQSYILLFTTVVYNMVHQKLNVSISKPSLPLVPFTVPQSFLVSNQNNKEVMGFNDKELRKAMSFLLESPQVLTPCAIVEFLGMIIPVALALELQASMLKVQFFGMIYFFDPFLCHVVLMMYFHFLDAFDGQEGEIARRLMLISRETQHFMVFRLLALLWLLGLLSRIMLSGEVNKYRSILRMGVRFYPAVFDALAIKALKLDLLVVCSECLDTLKEEREFGEEMDTGKSMVRHFENGIVSVSAFKWLHPWSTETIVAFHTFHKFLIGASSHSDKDPSTNRIIMESTIFHTLQGMLVHLALEFQRLVPVIVSFIDRLLGCQEHCWLGERLLQTIDQYLLPKVKMGYNLVFYFPIFDRIAANNTIPPSGFLDLLMKYMIFLVDKHGPDAELKSWSQGSKVLRICRTLLMHHQSSRLFLGLSHLLAFTCLYFPDLEVRDNARMYLRMLICIPGMKLRSILSLGEKLLGVSPSSHSSSFFNVQSPKQHQNFKKSRNISLYIHLERVIPLLVKQSWSLSLSTLGAGSSRPIYLDSIRDSEPQVDIREIDAMSFHSSSKIGSINQSEEPLRVMDSKISEVLGTLRRHFSCIPDFRHMPGLKVRIPCHLRFESEPFNQIWGADSPTSHLGEDDALPAIYATVLKFSSSAPYGSIPSYHIPFLLGEPSKNFHVPGLTDSLGIVPVENGSGEEETFRASVTIDLEPQEPTPGLVDVFIEANAENGQIIRGQLQSVTVGIEDMFLKAIIPSDIPEDSIPAYYSELFDALWEACGASSSIGGEIFPLEGGKGLAAINGTRSVKLLEVPAASLIQAIENYLAPFVITVIGEQLVKMVRDGEIIRNIIWKDDTSEALLSNSTSTSITSFDRSSPLHLTYFNDEDEIESQVSISKRNLGNILVLIFLPPRFHLLFQMEVSDLSTLVRIRTDHWPCLAYVDDYLENLFMVQG